MLITPYTAQRNKLNEVVRSLQGSGKLPEGPRANVKVSAVDGCHCASVDFVTPSLVRSEPGVPTGGNLNIFCAERRVNGMLLRAQSHLRVIRDMVYLSSSGGVWKSWWDHGCRRWKPPGLMVREHINIVTPDGV